MNNFFSAVHFLTQISTSELDTVLDDNSFIAQMKADIIRRAEELSDDEYETIEAPAKIVPFEEELEEDVDNSYVKVRGPDEESDSDRDELQMIEVSRFFVLVRIMLTVFIIAHIAGDNPRNCLPGGSQTIRP